LGRIPLVDKFQQYVFILTIIWEAIVPYWLWVNRMKISLDSKRRESRLIINLVSGNGEGKRSFSLKYLLVNFFLPSFRSITPRNKIYYRSVVLVKESTEFIKLESLKKKLLITRSVTSICVGTRLVRQHNMIPWLNRKGQFLREIHVQFWNSFTTNCIPTSHAFWVLTRCSHLAAAIQANLYLYHALALALC
jgi:hypothetical protein